MLNPGVSSLFRAAAIISVIALFCTVDHFGQFHGQTVEFRKIFAE
jgi:hypothetical protein